MTSASGSRNVPFARQHVWRALAGLPEYCGVCDVSYVVVNASNEGVGRGTRFICIRGRHSDAALPDDAVEGEIVEWVQDECFGTRLQLASETWHARTELADASQGTTLVTISVNHEADRGSPLLRGLRHRKVQALVRSTLESELARLPDHLRAVAPRGASALEIVQQDEGWVLHLRGEVDAHVVRRLDLERRLTAATVVAIDVSQLTYIDASAFPPLVRWARRASQEGRPAIVRGGSAVFDETVGVIGVASAFVRDA